MAVERLMGMQILNDEMYTRYREEMSPLLKEYDGSFRYDFKVSEVLQSESSAPINRVFIIGFPSEEKMESFFINEKYLKIKETYFAPSVGAVTPIALYETEL